MVKNRVWQKGNKPRKNAVARAWNAANPEKAAAHTRRYKYGVTAERYDEMVKAQDGVCAICGGEDKYRLSVDHCHTTKRVRGLLCGNCNRMLGLAAEDTARLVRAAEYLDTWKEAA